MIRLLPFPTQSRVADDQSMPPREAPLRICMLAACPFPANHGTPGSIREMAEAIGERGHDVHVVTYHFGENIPIRGVQLHRIAPLLKETAIIVGPTRRRPFYDFQMVWKTLEVIRRYRPALLHAHGYEAALVAWVCRLLTGLPIVYSGHNTMGDELASYGFFRPRWVGVALAKLLDVVIPRLADRCIPHSINLREFFLQGKLADCMEPVISFGIDLEAVPQGDGPSVRAQYGLGDAPVVAYAGVLNEFQRLDLLLEAMALVVRRVPAAKLFVITNVENEPFVAEFRRQAERLGLTGRVVLTKPQPIAEMQKLLAAADVAVVPRPHAPGFPIKLLNYMAAARPCVLFASSARELGDAHCAHLAHSDTKEALAEALLDVLLDADLRQWLGRQGSQYLWKNHDRRLTAERVCAAYIRTLLGRNVQGWRLPFAGAPRGRIGRAPQWVPHADGPHYVLPADEAAHVQR
ncbi:MAG: glycosyltransferase family 4 protein [Thermoguttaceae bacterium]|jgi:glycosyltransferase involved in cell wall biosynthesis